MKKLNLVKKVSAFMLSAAMLFGVGYAVSGFSSLTSYAAEIQAKASIQSALVTADKQNIQIKATTSGDMTGTDGQFYLFETQSYRQSLDGRSDYLAKISTGSSTTNIPLNRGKADDRLYSSFVVAVYDGSKYIPVSEVHYVTNPEVVAPNQAAFNQPLTKKGLNIEINMLGDAFELGVKHVATNITFDQIMGQGIDFTYDGKTYHFNKSVIEQYDKTISALSGKGMTVTAILLNGYNANEPDLFQPGTQKTDKAAYYLFNAETEAGFEKTRAIAAFLAQRYNGSNVSQGKVSNWIIGNEINNQYWNYVGPKDLTAYVRSYEKAFRLFYTAIKSTSANDRVYYSLDYNWNNPDEKNGQTKYGGKEIVDSFNSQVMAKGDIAWGLSYHPYPFPMTEPEFWDDVKTGKFSNDENSQVINFANLGTLTDYFKKSALSAPDGKPRHIILTEQGFTATSATRGDVEQLQAAAYAYSYYLVDSNPLIDAYILSRQVDAPVEVRSGLSFGLWKCDMSKGDQIVATQRRKIWAVFKNIDKKSETLENTAFAKSLIGIQKWSDVVPNFKWRALEK
jgi:hypothetical protein